ncbi:MAG TPA: MFS transporter [Steroidobacteraceae bacterium]|nr:MFS transporter [Steroidobacteraceae bacterium]
MAVDAERTIDLSELLDERAISSLQALVAILSALIMFVDGYDVTVMALAVPVIAREWSITAPQFSYALSAVLLGLSVGAAFFAPIGDRAGRRTLLVIALTLIGVATMATATAASPVQFVLWRLLTGIGMGVSIPNCNAWTAEYVPTRSRATILVIMNAAIGAGSFCAGFIAPVIFAHWGWRGAFLIGGAAPLVIGFLILAWAPESLKFLAVRRPDDPRIPAIVQRIAPELRATSIRRPAAAAPSPRWSLGELLGAVYRRRTLVLWGLVVANLFTLYVLISWLPTLLHADGWSLDDALRGAVLIQAGGIVGGILLSLFLRRGQTLPALFTAYLMTAVCLVLFGAAGFRLSWVILALIGAGTSGCQLALNALSTAYYPPAIKATGMGWAGVLGNIGAFLAPIAGGWAIDRGISAGGILATLAVMPVLCAVGVLLMRREWQWN